MKLVIRTLVILAIVGIVAALVLTGTIDLQSAFGTSQKEFADARELLLAEDFGVGIILGGKLSGAKARIQLMVALGGNLSLDAIKKLYQIT